MTGIEAFEWLLISPSAALWLSLTVSIWGLMEQAMTAQPGKHFWRVGLVKVTAFAIQCVLCTAGLIMLYLAS